MTAQKKTIMTKKSSQKVEKNDYMALDMVCSTPIRICAKKYINGQEVVYPCPTPIRICAKKYIGQEVVCNRVLFS